MQVLGPALIGKDPCDQEGLDALMLKLDGTANKGSLGANAVLGASLAISKAGAGAKKIPLFQHYAQVSRAFVELFYEPGFIVSHLSFLKLSSHIFFKLAGHPTGGEFTMPVPCFNVINGGEHAGNKLAFQVILWQPIIFYPHRGSHGLKRDKSSELTRNKN